MEKTLYKRTSAGKIQVWSIETEWNKFRTRSGQLGGAMTVSNWTTCYGKNVDKANETQDIEQALLEAEAKVTKKLNEGYSETVDAVDEAAMEISPMLAHPYDKYKEKLLGKGMAVQPKLDGMRCIGTSKGLFSRKGKVIVIAPHIHEEVVELLKYLPQGSKIDGELYNHAYADRFEELISICKKARPTTEDFEESQKHLEYHIYDIEIPGEYKERYTTLLSIFEEAFRDTDGTMVNDYVKLVETQFIQPVDTLIWGQADWDERFSALYARFVEQGYEGMIARTMDGTYKNGRSSDLLKIKTFDCNEFPIIEFLEGQGNRSGMAGKVVVQLPDGLTCEAGIKGGEAYYTKLWENRFDYTGKLAKIVYFGYTAYNKLRFPVCVEVDRQDA